MEEKVLIKSKLKDSKLFCIIIALLGAAIYLICGLITAQNTPFDRVVDETYDPMKYVLDDYAYAFGFENGANSVLIPLMIICPIVAFIIYYGLSREEMTVTNKRVFGITAFRKRVDIPLDSISAISQTSLFSGVGVASSSGKIVFYFLENQDEIFSTVSKLIQDRQSGKKEDATTTDELKRYKELLDSGVITQEEFDAKKKQLLGL